MSGRTMPAGEDLTYEEAVRDHLEDLIAEHGRGEIDWTGLDPLQVADYLNRWLKTGHGQPSIAEALWRYYEWANP